jgi:hypothetical protein
MLLGDLLAQVERADFAGNAAALLDDLSLLTRVAAAAGREGIDPDAYVVAAVRRFERGASSDDWVGIMSKTSNDANPGSACLQRMVEWALNLDRC